jgi:hypothetical protein
MASFDPNDLDRLVEAKLKEAPMAPAPLGLCREVRRRVAAAAVAKREHRRFHKLVSGSFFAFTATAVLLAIAAIVFDLPGRLALAIPGILGYFDYVGSAVGHSWMLAAAFGAPMALLVVAAALWVGLRSAR